MYVKLYFCMHLHRGVCLCVCVCACAFICMSVCEDNETKCKCYKRRVSPRALLRVRMKKRQNLCQENELGFPNISGDIYVKVDVWCGAMDNG